MRRRASGARQRGSAVGTACRLETLEGRALLSGVINEVPVSSTIYQVLDVTSGPDGALWFTEDGAGKIGRLDPTTGAITEYPAPNPQMITAGPDGNLWFTERNGDTIGEMTPDGSVTQFPLPGGLAPNDIVTGPDGSLWFTSSFANTVGRISTSGQVTLFNVGSMQLALASGPDGNLWFSTLAGIGKITPGGQVTQFPVAGAGQVISSLTAGPDGNVWFTVSGGGSIGKITPDGAVTEFRASDTLTGPNTIIAGPDGNLWFTDSLGNEVSRITPTGQVTQFPIPTASSQPQAIVTGSDGNLWFVERQASQIGELVIGHALTADAVDVPGQPGEAFDGVVATFSSPNSADGAGDFTATVRWGDGTTSPGAITSDGHGGFQVTASHDLSQADGGGFRVSITANQDTVSATVFGHVLLPPNPGGGGPTDILDYANSATAGSGVSSVVTAPTGSQAGLGAATPNTPASALVQLFRDALMHSAQMNSRLRHPRGPLAISHTLHHATRLPVHHHVLPTGATVHHAAQMHHAGTLAAALMRHHH